MSNEELIKDYLENIHQLEKECYEKRKLCTSMDEKIAIYDDYDKDIQAYKDEIVKLTE